jgi:hypothetical protein
MISTKPLPTKKPLLSPQFKRFPKGNMTFAVGMLSSGGVVIAADSQITYGSGTTEHVCKVRAELTSSGSYAIAYAADDANAAESLVDEIAQDLAMRDPKSLVGVESVIRDAMKKWASVYTVAGDRPLISLIVGAFVKETPPANPKDIGLYLCEPPATVVRKVQENASAFVSAGAGKYVADPLFRILFARPASSRVRLAQICYLMHRVKKDCGGACGGETDAIVLPFRHVNPSWIVRTSMAQGEARAWLMDEALACTAATVIPEIDGDEMKELLRLMEQIDFKRAGFRNIDFQVLGGGTIE